ncbi:hypothetical protein ILYODFUR_014012 [Ilyodon furcidens]|uniref:Ciliary microtubule inner protein 2B n=1 Tax=Ilyodon furcidens TaxID=33524 RepID=A0ABV0U5A9_9TELE
MDESVHERSKALLSNAPYHIPGYTGHCPGLRFSSGKPFGKLTAEVLSKKKHPESDTSRLPVSIPDDVLKKTIPGYSGFIPRSKNYFGCNYSETCRKAMTEVYLENQARLQQRSVHLPVITSWSSQHPNRPKPPLMAVSDNIFLYKPLKPFMPSGNPYQMDEDDPQKYFISGIEHKTSYNYSDEKFFTT